MKYMGSKAKHAKEILAVIDMYRKPNQAWVEPFVGGANMIDKVTAPLRIGGDTNEYLIRALRLIQNKAGALPLNSEEYTEEMFYKAKDLKNLSDVDCLMLFACSFGAMFNGAWAKGHPTEDFVRAARNNALRQSPLIEDVLFFNSTYDKLPIPDNSLIYCDPPYQNTAKYKGVEPFDHDKFWQWCRDMTNAGHTVFVSEYSAPWDFVPIWTKDVKTTISKTKKATEALFVWVAQLQRDTEHLL